MGTVITFFVIYGLLNLPSFWSKINYDLNIKNNPATQTQLAQLPAVKAAQKEGNLPALEGVLANQSTTVVLDNYLIIPKLSINAPVIWDVPEDQILSQLHYGVAHYAGTAKPGQIGNVFITGHSSYYYWDKGKYKTVFSLLNKLEPGDQIGISFQNKFYTYQVYDKVVVLPQDLEVLEQGGNAKTLSLMTCTPVGTAWKRLVVKTKLIE